MSAGFDADDVGGVEAQERVDAHGKAGVAIGALCGVVVVHEDHGVAVDPVEDQEVHAVGLGRIELERARVLDSAVGEVAAVLGRRGVVAASERQDGVVGNGDCDWWRRAAVQPVEGPPLGRNIPVAGEESRVHGAPLLNYPTTVGLSTVSGSGAMGKLRW